VSVLVVALPPGGEVDPRHDAIAEVVDTRHTGIEQRDGHAAAVDPGGNLREPDRLPPREVRFEVVVHVGGGGGHVDATVGVEARDRTVRAEHRQTVGRHVGGEPADQGESLGDAAADGEDEALRGVGEGRPLVDDDRGEVLDGSGRRADERGDEERARDDTDDDGDRSAFRDVLDRPGGAVGGHPDPFW
jgi:hypothetical protein